MTSVSLIEWLGHSSLLLAACGGLYYGLLRRETCLRYTRLYLLLTPALAALGPLLQVVKSCRYPAEARAAVPGVVLVSFVVGADGPGQIEPRQSFFEPLDQQTAQQQPHEAAVQAVAQSLQARWQPGRQDGR